MAAETSTSVEDKIRRVGFFWRKNPTKCVVEMRPPMWRPKLNFGSYDTVTEAMIARDYGAYLRFSAGEPSRSAGGYDADDRPSIYEFEESLEVFESLADSEVRCDEYKRLHPLYYQQPKEKWNGDANPPHKEFCKKARNDIAAAIREFRRRQPHKFVTCRPATEAAQGLPKAQGSPGVGTHFTSRPSTSESPMRAESLTMAESPTMALSLTMAESPTMAENKQECRWADLQHGRLMSRSREYHHKGNFPFGIKSFNHHLSSSPDGKSCHAIRGFNANPGDSMFDGQSQGMPPWIKESSKHEIKKDSKSLLQVQLANNDSLDPWGEGFHWPIHGVRGFSAGETQLEDGVNPNCDQGMSPMSITHSGAPASLSSETSLEDETELSGNNRNNCRPEMPQREYPFREGGDILYLDDLPQGEVAEDEVSDLFDFGKWDASHRWENGDQNVVPGVQWWYDDEQLQDVDFIKKIMTPDIPIPSSITIPRKSDGVLESVYGPSHTLATTTNSTAEVDKVKVASNKVVSKAAANKVMSKAEMVEEQFKSRTPLAKGCSTSFAHREALLAAEFALAVEQSNTVKIANLRAAKDDGVISNEEYKQRVKALLDL